MTDQSVIENRLKHLETHLAEENPVLLNAVQSYRDLDKVARRLGLLDKNESFATTIPWWPMISILGTFSAGKSTFINDYLGITLQRSGNQAVDDRFTVICYSEDEEPHILPGVALDSDPRFPFYKISRDIETVAEGEGGRIDSYLQLKTCNSNRLKGKILIDSPGFDADAQRTSTLRITRHIVDLSDLVLVFFDARHPEPGAMRDTLEHLVASTISRTDSGKFLYILNQIDTAANEDNPEEVIAAWQRALGDRGLTAGRFYTIYSDKASVHIEDEKLRRRYENKRDQDLAEIYNRMEQVEIDRAYRIVSTLEKTSREIEDKIVPTLSEGLAIWKKRTLWLDIFLLGVAGGIGLWLAQPGWWSWSMQSMNHGLTAFAILAAVLYALHLTARSLAARSLIGWFRKQQQLLPIKVNLTGAFKRNTAWWRPMLIQRTSAGWRRGTRRLLARIINQADAYVQELNDRFTNPSGAAHTGADEATDTSEKSVDTQAQTPDQ